MQYSVWLLASYNRQNFSLSCTTDECVDCANNEQLVICLRYVDGDLEVRRVYRTFYKCEDITANTIVAVLKDSLLRLNLQCCAVVGSATIDGGSNMAGCKNGVKVQILKEEPQALFTHCYGHALSLSVADTVKRIKCLGSTVDTVH